MDTQLLTFSKIVHKAGALTFIAACGCLPGLFFVAQWQLVVCILCLVTACGLVALASALELMACSPRKTAKQHISLGLTAPRL